MFSQVTASHEVMPYFLIANINQRVWDELVNLIYLLFRQLNGALWNKKHHITIRINAIQGNVVNIYVINTTVYYFRVPECQSAKGEASLMVRKPW